MNIRKGTKGDLPSVLGLIHELATYENAPEEVTVSLVDLERDGFGERPLFEILIAEVDEEVVAMALYFMSYSTWKGKCIYLEDIVVKKEHRRQGIGVKLFEALVVEARTMGAQRLQWQVLDWNTPAIYFYKKMDANLDSSWINCRLTHEQLAEYRFS